ncbi:VTT domain-containing protein [Herbaspirillum lusitanum]|uniref:VTT domain-containing protein n=1 Tax=Herbaspirillum lusitanum TaxID=213312 RepID=UPI002238EE7C|nr:VTT domain-containing protein [Herbaspirillum lusitanum]
MYTEHTEHTGPAPSRPRLLEPGKNCWRIAPARRFKLLIDADAYFSAVRAAVRQARHSVFILGWDIDSRMRLAPGGAGDGYPEALGDFLNALVEERPQLHVYILNWDFAMLYALEREWPPAYKHGWRKRRRFYFHMDASHPVGASHHQKVVVIDDKLAFAGGIDLTRNRWDTSEHAPDQPLRRDIDDKPYGPFHDVQAMVDAEAAAALGELARERWTRAGCKPALPPNKAKDGDDLWPTGVEPDLGDVEIGIARTEPERDGGGGIHEIRQLYLDAIAAARHSLFFENQYFTSNVLHDALAARLAEDDAPEVVVVSPQNQSGWLEQATMGHLRARIHQRLKAADQHGRYRMYCPQLAGEQDGCLNVHSKVFAVDDHLFCVGSANMSNRSMTYDTECNLVIEAHGDAAQQARIGTAIAGMRNRLLAEHLDVGVETVRQEIDKTSSLHATIAALQSNGRTLIALDPVVLPQIEALMPDKVMFDPETPINPDELIAQFVPGHARKPVPRRLIGLGVFGILLLALALAWRFTPLREWLNLNALIVMARSLETLPFTPLAVMAVYVVAGMLMFPVTLLIAVTGIVFGPFYGALYALAGSLLSALAGFGLGVWLGRETLQQLLGRRVNSLSRRFAQRGIPAMVVIRLLPVAPFTIANVVAGVSHLRLRDYLIGTFLGMAPGIIVTVAFAHNLAEAIRHPSLTTVALLAGMAALLIGMALGLQKLFSQQPRSIR